MSLPTNRRLLTFLAVSFATTWGAWGALASLTRAGILAQDRWPFMVLHVLGGLAPTIGAYAAVLATPAQAPLREFHRRLFRWRVAGGWYLVAFGLPVALAAASVGIARLLGPEPPAALSMRPWIQLLPLFAVMILGGGLEELGWRGVAQPELTRAHGLVKAALLVGLVWAVWHAPLFLIPGVSQHGSSFPLFAVGVIGSALILGWLYARTESILLCVIFHASGNAIATLGLAIPREQGWLTAVGPFLSLAVGAALLLADRALSRERAAIPLGRAPGAP